MYKCAIVHNSYFLMVLFLFLVQDKINSIFYSKIKENGSHLHIILPPNELSFVKSLITQSTLTDSFMRITNVQISYLQTIESS